MFASLDFVQTAIARARFDNGLVGATVVALRRRAETVFVAIVTSMDEPLSVSSVAVLHRLFDAVVLGEPETIRSELEGALRTGIARHCAVSVLAIDDRTRTATAALAGHALWVRRGTVLVRLDGGSTTYRPGDSFLLADAADAFSNDDRDGVVVLGTSRRASSAARDFLAAIESSARPGSQLVQSVVAISAGSRDAMVARRRLVIAAAASFVIHFIVTGGLGWLLHPPPHAGSRETSEPAAIVTISSARHKPPPPTPHRPAPVVKVAVAQKASPHIARSAKAPQPVQVAQPAPPKPVIVPPHITSHLPSTRVAERGEAPAHRYSAAELAALSRRLADATQGVQRADPLAVPSTEPAAPKRYAMDISEAPGHLIRGQGILKPIQTWHKDGYTYYYVSYEIRFSDGTYESGDVPWPIRYLPQDDPFKEPPHTIPLPAPLPDYVLPPGTHLGRALRPYFSDTSTEN